VVFNSRMEDLDALTTRSSKPPFIEVLKLPDVVQKRFGHVTGGYGCPFARPPYNTP